MNGALSGSTAVTVTNGSSSTSASTLGGTGSITGTVYVDGPVAGVGGTNWTPTINPGGINTAGTFNVVNVNYADAGKFVADLLSTNSYDQLKSTGTVSLKSGVNNAVLSVNILTGATIAVNDTFTIISATTLSSYTFTNLTNNASMTTNGYTFQGVYAAKTLILTCTATAPAVDNDGGASNITISTATLNGNLTSTGGAPTCVYVFWGTIDGGNTNTAWANTNNFGTNAAGTFLSNNVSSLTEGTTYYYRFYATNSVGGKWASGSSIFVASAAPAINNDSGGASNITYSSATVSGSLTSTGGAPTTVFLCWGAADGGTTNTAWGGTNNFGTNATGPVSFNLTSLADATTYYYRFYATNSVGVTWASSTMNFPTPLAISRGWLFEVE